MRIPGYAQELSKEKDVYNPDKIIGMYLGSTKAPELDSYFHLGNKTHWKYILETYNNLEDKQ